MQLQHTWFWVLMISTRLILRADVLVMGAVAGDLYSVVRKLAEHSILDG